MARSICWLIQEQALGELDPDVAKLLDGFVRGNKPNRRLKPGTLLVREYAGERHTVTVIPGGYVWRETAYASLSTVARIITGTAWNGPRFFGLRPSLNSLNASKHEPTQALAGAPGSPRSRPPDCTMSRRLSRQVQQ
jgi:hypothetical protein